jgi:class 3 adenylate cyclase/predicted ATPase
MWYVFGDCTLDTELYVVQRTGLTIPLRPKVFQVLHYLLRHRDRVISKQELQEQVWPDQFVSDAALEGVLKAVRQAVGDSRRTQWCIQTRRGQGYRFVAPLVEPGGAPQTAESPTASPAPVPPEVRSQAPAVAAPTPDALAPSRRQLTVLSCDLVDATALAGQLDPEDWHAVVLAYHATCTEVIQRFDGYMAQYLGDGLLVYFGYPNAQEDAAQRAVRSGLGIVEAMGTLHTRLARDHGVRLAVRLGIHTGLVMVGAVGGAGRQEQLAFGETPNVAARLQSLARPNQVVLSARTQRLVGGEFVYEDLGVHALLGVSEPLRVYSVRGEGSVESRFEAATAAGRTPFVGRDEELGLLLRRWEQAKEGEGQVVLLVGEPGIGKSRLTQTLHERIVEEPHLRVQYQCLPYYTNSAFSPILRQLERAARFLREDTPAQKLDKLEALLASGPVPIPEVAPLLAALLALPTGDRYPPLTLSPQRQKERTLEALADQFVEQSRQQPVVCLFEDAHWSDPSSLELLDLLVYRVPALRVLVVITSRPEFASRWGGYAHVTTHTLNRLTRREGAALVAAVTGGKALPPAVLEQVVAKTDGVPLFVEELTKTVLESNLLVDQGDHYALAGSLPPLAVPATLQDALLARLDRLAAVKEVAQIGAVLGREFAYELLAAVSLLREEALQDALDQFVHAGLLFRRGIPPEASYRFKHALVQDAAYASLLKSTRQQLHTRTATVLKEQFPALADAEPEVLAHHYTEAGRNEEAIPYWHRAGQRALGRSANAEAIGHLTKGLEVLTTLPDTPERWQEELALQMDLGVALTVTKGFTGPELEQVYTRAYELCQRIGDIPKLVLVLYSLWNVYLVRAALQTALEVAQKLSALAQCEQDPIFLMMAHSVQGQTRFMRGEIAVARTHLEQGIALYDPQQYRSLALVYGEDPGILCRVFAVWALWCLGYPEQSLHYIHELQTLAEELSHPFSWAEVLFFGAMGYQFRRDGQTVAAWAERLMTLCREQDFALWLAGGMLLHGWTRTEQGQWEEGIAQMRQGLADWRSTGAESASPYFLALLAEAYEQAGQAEAGLSAVADALAVVYNTGVRWWEAELYRLQGEGLRRQVVPDEQQAEACFRQALNVARQQQAKSLELRVAISLSRLWQQQGKGQEAHDLLAPIYGWFTEGFDTADLQEAKTLLKELT